MGRRARVLTVRQVVEAAVTLHDCADRISAMSMDLRLSAEFGDKAIGLDRKMRAMAYKLEVPLERAGGPLVLLSAPVARELLAALDARPDVPLTTSYADYVKSVRRGAAPTV